MRDEGEGDAFEQTAAGQRAPGQGSAGLARRVGGQRHGRHNGHGDGWHIVQPAQAQHFLDQIGFGLGDAAAFCSGERAFRQQGGGLVQRTQWRDVIAPWRHGDRDAFGVAAAHGKAQTLQPAHGLVWRHGQAAEPVQPFEPQAGVPLPSRFLPGLDQVARLTSTKLDHHGGGSVECGREKRRVDAAFEAAAGVRDDVVAAAAECHSDRVEQRALDEYAGGRCGAAGRLAAHHAGN